jgi:hypothetical protein
MDKTRVAACLASLAAFALGPAHAQDKPCTRADAANAEKAIERVVGWGQLHKAWQDYRHCDTGLNEELFTDAVLRLVVEWREVEVVAESMGRDAKYKEFIHRHIGGLTAMGDRPSIYSRAKASCPAKLEAFCAELAEVAKP